MNGTISTFKYLLTVAVAVMMARWSTVVSAAGGPCPTWMCGSNHDETLVRDRR